MNPLIPKSNLAAAPLLAPPRTAPAPTAITAAPATTIHQDPLLALGAGQHMVTGKDLNTVLGQNALNTRHLNPLPPKGNTSSNVALNPTEAVLLTLGVGALSTAGEWELAKPIVGIDQGVSYPSILVHNKNIGDLADEMEHSSSGQQSLDIAEQGLEENSKVLSASSLDKVKKAFAKIKIDDNILFKANAVGSRVQSVPIGYGSPTEYGDVDQALSGLLPMEKAQLYGMVTIAAHKALMAQRVMEDAYAAFTKNFIQQHEIHSINDVPTYQQFVNSQ